MPKLNVQWPQETSNRVINGYLANYHVSTQCLSFQISLTSCESCHWGTNRGSYYVSVYRSKKTKPILQTKWHKSVRSTVFSSICPTNRKKCHNEDTLKQSQITKVQNLCPPFSATCPCSGHLQVLSQLYNIRLVFCFCFLAFFWFCFEAGSYSVALAGLELTLSP